MEKITVCPLFNFEMNKENVQEFQISEQISLRKIKSDELATLKSRPYLYLLGDCSSLISSSTFVFEIKSYDPANETLLVYEALLAMRLFKKGSVCVKHFFNVDNTKINYFFTINTPIPKWIKNDYLLTVDEVDEIKKLMEKIIQIELRSNKSFRVACERFSRSFEERREDDKVIDLAIAFEALFTDENTSRTNVMGELIGVGCAMLLGISPNERDEIKQFFRKVFNIRNKIIHGSEVKFPIIINKKKYKMQDIASQLQEFLRASIKKLL